VITRSGALGCAVIVAMSAAGCVVGPKYHAASVQTPPAYKEATQPTATAPGAQPATPEQTGTAPPFTVAQPQDDTIHGKWWEMFNDPELNTLEEQVNISNQNVAAAVASYYSARAIVREAGSQFFPTVTTNPSIAKARSAPTYNTLTDYSLPGDASWVPDLWGRIRNTVSEYSSIAQVSAADLENTRLSMQADLAVDYYDLRGEDALKQLLDSTVVAYQQSLDLTRALYDTGIDSDESVAQAETQLESVQAEDIGVGIARAQYEHAIAVLTGQPPSTFSIPAEAKPTTPPTIPLSTPSELLQRRPDIAAAERTMAEANALIGIATAAYYPNVTLSASGGFTNIGSAADWLTWPSRVWSIGASLSETLFDAGLRRATVQQYLGVYNQDIANYRQTVLTAFQQVEDNLASGRILRLEVQQQDAAVASAQRNLNLATDRYRLGIDPYLNVITAETTLLSNQQTAVNLRTQQMNSAVGLIEALGGGWNTSLLPSPQAVRAVGSPTASTSTPASGNQATQ